METFSALLAICAGNSPVTGEFPAHRPVTRSYGVFLGLRLKKWLSKRRWGCWFEMPSHSLWRHCNEDPIITRSNISQCSIGITVMSHAHHGISNQWQLACVFNHLFKLPSKKTSKSVLLALCEGNHRWLVVSAHKGPVMRQCLDVIMRKVITWNGYHIDEFLTTGCIGGCNYRNVRFKNCHLLQNPYFIPHEEDGDWCYQLAKVSPLPLDSHLVYIGKYVSQYSIWVC